MRIIRTLATVGLSLSLLALPGLTVGQIDGESAAMTVPQARLPDGRLPFAGTPWRLVGYADRGREAVPGPEVAAFIRFGPGTYVGSGGCSRIAGAYGLSGTALSVEPEARAGRDCAENLALVQQAVEEGLRKAAAFEIRPGSSGLEDELVVLSATGAPVLRYALDHVSPLDGSQWRLASYTVAGEATSASASLPGLLSFRPDSEARLKRRQSGSLAGSSGCNGIVGQFFRRSDVLSFSELDRTDAPCTDELAAQEAAMVAVLDASAVRLDLPADRLVLTSADTGDRLEFVSQSPLQGTTWWLQRTAADGGLGGLRVTLRLDGGIVSGEGPCGPYQGRYVTDGSFITFQDVEGARDGDCPRLRTEQALISGLRRAVRVDRRPDRIGFLDARGGETLTFARPIGP